MEHQQPDTLADLSDLVVLVVDDEEDTLLLVDRLLTRQGARVICAGCAAEGLTALSRHCPDVIISDLQMRGGDGFGFMRFLRGAKADYPRLVPSIAFSSLSGDADRRHAREAGFWRYLTKPAVASVLCEEVATLGRAHKRFQRGSHEPPTDA